MKIYKGVAYSCFGDVHENCSTNSCVVFDACEQELFTSLLEILTGVPCYGRYDKAKKECKACGVLFN